MPPTLEEIVQGTVELIRSLDGIGTVDSVKNGASTWSQSPGDGQFYWIVDHVRTASRQEGVGGTQFSRGTTSRKRTIVIDGWTPWSVAGATSEAFRDKINDVEWLIIQNRTLGVCAKMTGLIRLVFNKIEPYTSLNQSDEPRNCHHARWEFDVTGYREHEGE